MESKRPNPGSDEALAAGCKCPVLDNSHGKGYMGVEGTFVISELCPMHVDQMPKWGVEPPKKLFGVLVYEGWGKTFMVEADNEEEAQKIFEDSEDPYEDFTLSKEQMNETFVVEVNE